MKRSSILVTLLGSALLMGGVMFKAPRVTADPSLLYLAGQAKMALGDTSGGLQLISRAARQREAEQQIAAPQMKPKQTLQASSACSDRTAVKKQEPTLTAKTAPKKLEKNTTTVVASASEPRFVLAKMSFPAGPFRGEQDVPGMTREQVARVTAEYQQQIQRWSEEQTARRFEIAKLTRMTTRAADAVKGHHPQVIRVVVPEAPAMTEFPPEPPRTNP